MVIPRSSDIEEKEENWTKGPWIIGDENNHCCEVIPQDGPAITIHFDRLDRYTDEYCISRFEMLANAHLVAAAPELYKALAHIAQQIKNDEEGKPTSTDDEYRIWFKEMTDALAKARGE
jgi:hypothetical protein